MKDIAAAANASKVQARDQAWREHGNCPAGTVPIRRESNPTKVADLLAGLPSPFGHPDSYNASVAAAQPAGSTVEVGSIDRSQAYLVVSIDAATLSNAFKWSVNTCVNALAGGCRLCHELSLPGGSRGDTSLEDRREKS